MSVSFFCINCIGCLCKNTVILYIPFCICNDFLKKIASYINSSPKQSTIFFKFSECFEDKYQKIVKLSQTRLLSHYKCVDRLIQSWNTIYHFLREMIVSEKIKSAKCLLSMIDNLEIKAYFLFLKYILYFFNVF